MAVKEIRKAAVLGSGVMGATIAAHLANVGIPSLLLDIIPRELTPEEEEEIIDDEDEILDEIREDKKERGEDKKQDNNNKTNPNDDDEMFFAK